MVHFFLATFFEFATFQVLGMLIQISGKFIPGAMTVKILFPKLLYHVNMLLFSTQSLYLDAPFVHLKCSFPPKKVTKMLG